MRRHSPSHVFAEPRDGYTPSCAIAVALEPEDVKQTRYPTDSGR